MSSLMKAQGTDSSSVRQSVNRACFEITLVMLLTTDLAQLELANPHQLLTSVSESHE
jgi:hypothetical protein